MLTNREEYIKKTFFSDLSEGEAEELVKKISEVGNSIGFIGGNANQDNELAEKRKHKYDVWISKEVKKSRDIINRLTDIRLIVDWASETNADIFKSDFDSAYQLQAEWHDDMRRKYRIENMDIPSIEEDRVIFRFSDQEHFLYLLTPKDLKLEGAVMGHCVGGKNYKSKIKNKQSLIFSVRDKSNMPHVTMEIDVNSRSLIQSFGKGNKPPVEKYNNMLFEYALFASDYKNLRNKEVLKFLNLNFITKT
jgi:muramidase (phage lysozyme)